MLNLERRLQAGGGRGKQKLRHIPAALVPKAKRLIENGRSSFSYSVMHGDIGGLTSQPKLHGLARGSGSVPRHHRKTGERGMSVRNPPEIQ